MSIEQHQQQQQHQHQQQYPHQIHQLLPQAASTSAKTIIPTTTTAAATTSEYANINIYDGTPLLQSGLPPQLPPPPPPLSMAMASTSTSTSTASNATLQNATFMTIGMLSTPMPQHTMATISPTSTSTFKTPLLPMPSLEDIEGSLLMAPQSQQQQQQQQQKQQHLQQYDTEQTLITQPQQHHQHHLHTQPIPGGILKYPPPPAVTNTITVGIPLGLGPGPGPPLQPGTVLNEQQALPSPPLTISQTTSMPPTTLPLPLPLSMPLSDCSGSLGMSSGILRNNATVSTVDSTTTTSINIGVNSGGTITSTTGCTVKTSLKKNNSGNPVGGMASTNNSNLRQKPTANTTKRRKCCCACFGRGNSTSNGKMSSKKHKRKPQTFCTAILTNLGICALLLAYTLLGSFIFLTIESEDSTLLQRTLASTKRSSIATSAGAGGGVGNGNGNGNGVGINGRGVRTNNYNNNNNNVFHSQQQQKQPQQRQYQHQQQGYQRLDNGTLTAAAATSSLASSHSSPSSSSNSYSSSSSMLEGIVPLNNVIGGIDGGHNDFTYANDNDVDDDGILAGGSSNGARGGTGAGIGFNDIGNDDNDAASQLALSADTYDVRQRTIENIWDITVSLNILYKENWTKLAALEIAKFQDQLIKRLNEDALLQLSHDIDDGNGAAAGVAASGNSPATEAVLLHSHHHHHLHHYHPHGAHEWNFARAFLYSLTVLTTIGYGNVAPRTTLGRLVTLVYALFGIPLTLVYLSSTGGILAKVAREVFSKALCCCLCSNCGYCCYDERRMAEKERRTKRKRQQEELRKQQAALQEPYYVRSGSVTESGFQTPEKQPNVPTVQLPDIDSLSASESRGSMHGLSILAPILLCLSMMVIYIVFGALVLYRLEEWALLDGIYFCFMSLSTIGFGDMLPGLHGESTTTTWFCSIYIMSGMALTAMCFNVIHEEIVHRIRIVVEFKQGNGVSDVVGEEQNIGSSSGGISGSTSYYIAS